MLRKSITIVLLNQTNEELALHQDSQILNNSQFISYESPPQSILAGEYGSWVVTSISPFVHMRGYLSYGISGTVPEQTIHFYWRTSTFGLTSYHGTQAPEGYRLRILGGEGFHSTVVFIFSV